MLAVGAAVVAGAATKATGIKVVAVFGSAAATTGAGRATGLTTIVAGIVGAVVVGAAVVVVVVVGPAVPVGAAVATGANVGAGAGVAEAGTDVGVTVEDFAVIWAIGGMAKSWSAAPAARSTSITSVAL
jgi:hypothetical protein